MKKEIVVGVTVALVTTAILWLLGVVKKIPPITVPKGTIVAWHPGYKIPNGWVVCDGKNGTPDLQDRFILGTTGVDRTGEAGGAMTHSHTVTVKSSSQFAETDRDGAHYTDAANLGHIHEGDALDSNHLPPFRRLIYIMKN